jgi:hypothetical protein
MYKKQQRTPVPGCLLWRALAGASDEAVSLRFRLFLLGRAEGNA